MPVGQEQVQGQRKQLRRTEVGGGRLIAGARRIRSAASHRLVRSRGIRASAPSRSTVASMSPYGRSAAM